MTTCHDSTLELHWSYNGKDWYPWPNAGNTVEELTTHVQDLAARYTGFQRIHWRITDTRTQTITF